MTASLDGLDGSVMASEAEDDDDEAAGTRALGKIRG